MKTYAKEIQALMESSFFLPLVKSGIFPGRVSVVKNASKLLNTDFGKIISLGAEVREKFRKAIMDGPESLTAKEAVTAYRELINMLISCDDTAFRKIAQAYMDNKEILDKKSPGLAEFVYEAVSHVYR